MKREATLPNCYLCGRFVGYKKPYVSWISYGHAFDMEPPDPEFAHQSCWEKCDWTGLIKRTSWLGPATYGGDDGERQQESQEATQDEAGAEPSVPRD